MHNPELTRERALVRRCNTHWCWACGHVADEAAVYDHMWREHGGIGLVDDGTYAFDEDDEVELLENVLGLVAPQRAAPA